MPGILLDTMEWCRSMLPGHRQAVVAEVSGVSETPIRRDVVRQLAPDVREHLAVVHV